MAAGSGGHILPALQLGTTWLKKNPNGKIMVFSSKKKLDEKILRSFSEITHTISLNINNYTQLGILRYPVQCVQLMIAFLKSLYGLLRFRPSQVISTGSIHTIPVVLAAKLLRIPIHLYELNAIPGKTVTFLAPFATSINGVFNKSKKYFGNNQKKFNQVPYPLKYDRQPEACNKELIIEVLNEFRQYPSSSYSFDSTRKTILLLGGSQGSQQLNEWLRDFLIRHPHLHASIQIIHQTGIIAFNWNSFYKNVDIPAHVFDYMNDLTPYYQLADLIICRAGAGTLFEVTHFQKQSIIIPLYTATTSHQYDNALEMSRSFPKLCTIVPEKDLKKNFTHLDNMVLEKIGL